MWDKSVSLATEKSVSLATEKSVSLAQWDDLFSPYPRNAILCGCVCVCFWFKGRADVLSLCLSCQINNNSHMHLMGWSCGRWAEYIESLTAPWSERWRRAGTRVERRVRMDSGNPGLEELDSEGCADSDLGVPTENPKSCNTLLSTMWEKLSIMYLNEIGVYLTKGFFVCNQLYLQVEGMSEFQPIKLLLLQLEEILTVCKALRHLEDRSNNSEGDRETQDRVWFLFDPKT